MSLEHKRARQPEIIRCLQKDALYVGQLRELLLELFECFCRPSQLKYFHQWSTIVGPILYYGFHSVFRLQTLGEEYTGIVQINRTFTGLPNRALQLFSYILEFCGETILIKCLKHCQSHVTESEDILPEVKPKLQRLLNALIKAIPYLKVAHLGLFYLNGDKYQIARRLTGLNFVLYNNLGRPKGYLRSYRWLGIITFLQLAVVGVKQYRMWSQLQLDDQNKAKARSECDLGQIPSESKCVLCLEPRRNAAATTCGHIFCWDCILHCLRNRPECPICREAVKSQNVIFLRNFA